MDAIFKIEDNDTFDLVVMNLLKQNYTPSQCSNAEITNNMVEAAKEDLRMSLVKANFDFDVLSEQILSNCSSYQDRVKQFISLLKERKTEFFQSIVTHYNSVFGDTVLDCMWSIKLVLGTSELKVLRCPILQLALTTANSNDQMKQKLYELSKESLLLMIRRIENSLNSDAH